jgi:hypothetical protein
MIRQREESEGEENSDTLGASGWALGNSNY